MFLCREAKEKKGSLKSKGGLRGVKRGLTALCGLFLKSGGSRGGAAPPAGGVGGGGAPPISFQRII